MKKRMWMVVVFVLLAIGALVFLLSRPGVPERDYFAEYEALRASRYPNGRAGVAAWEALAALDRFNRIAVIEQEAMRQVIAEFQAEGIDTEMWFDESFVAPHVFEDHAWILGRIDEEGRPISERVLGSARERALPRLIELQDDPAARSAVAAVLVHEIIAPVPPAGITLFDTGRPHLIQANGNIRPEQLVMLHSDDPALRFDAFRSILASGGVAMSEPSIVGCLVLMSVERQMLHAVSGVLGDGDVLADPSGFRPHDWLEALKRHQRLRPDIGWFLRGERLIALDYVDAEYRPRRGMPQQGNSLLTMPVLGVSHRRMYDLVNAYFDLTEAAASSRLGVRNDMPDQREAFLRDAGFRAQFLLTILLPYAGAVLDEFNASDARLAGMLAMFALLAYQFDHGAWPGSLDELVPAYLDRLPMDPFSPGGAAPLVYRLDVGGQPLLYSFGPNLRDDGGVRPEDPRGLRERGDMVFLPLEGASVLSPRP